MRHFFQVTVPEIIKESIDGFIIRVTNSSNSNAANMPEYIADGGFRTSHVIGPLDPGMAYSLQMAAFNERSVGQFSGLFTVPMYGKCTHLFSISVTRD